MADSSSSDDDQPIGARAALQAAVAPRADSDGEDGASPLPAWISQAATTPSQKLRGRMLSSDSDSVLDLATQPEPPGEEARQTSPGGDGAEQAQAQPAGQAKGKVKGRASQATAEAGPSKPAGAASQAAPSGMIPVVLPEKLAKGRVLVQLEPAEGGATDLAGDMGTVGRFAASDQPGREGDMMLDLKGVIYSTSVVPCATMLCVLNIQQHEARVEAAMDSFVSLRQEAAPGGIGADLQRFLDEDDDASLFDDGAGKPGKGRKRAAAGDDGTDGPPRKKRAPAKAAAGKAGSKPGAARRKPAAKRAPGGKAKAASKAAGKKK